MGPSGAGKSTLAALLNRFYEPTSGTLLVDDIDMSSLSRDEYLARVSVVRQAPALFTDTVANNIGKLDELGFTLLCKYDSESYSCSWVCGLFFTLANMLVYNTVAFPSLLSFSAYGAVAYRQVTREDIIAAAKAANAHSFISSLPEVCEACLLSSRLLTYSPSVFELLMLCRPFDGLHRDADMLLSTPSIMRTNNVCASSGV